MQGQSERLVKIITPNAYEYKFLTDTLVPLCDPCGENVLTDLTKGYPCQSEFEIPKWVKEHALGASYQENTTLIPSFTQAYIGKSNKKVIAVSVAKGSTTIQEWQKDGSLYNALINKVNSAIYKIGKEKINKKYLIFLQGESDAINNTSEEEYKSLLREYKNDLKKDIGIDKFCIIKVGAFAKAFCNGGGDKAILDAQENIVKEDADFIMLTRKANELFEDSKYINEKYVGHFNALALTEIGKDAGKRLGEIID